MTTLLRDDDIRETLAAADAVRWMREAVVAAERGALTAPPRVHASLGDGRLVFTTGATARWFGYRSYDTFGHDGDQVVVLHDRATGEVRGLALGHELGPRRVGAIGGVAADALARRDARSLAVVGTGTQAWTQLWGISAVRDLADVRVFSRRTEPRQAFARRATSELGLSCRAVRSAEEAVRGADVVVLATDSPSPVMDAEWLAPGSYLTTLGPKQVGRAEFGPDLVAVADVAVTDSIAQIDAYDPPNVLVGTAQEDRLVSLGSVLAGTAPGRTGADEVVVFCSVGLAGTEVYLLSRLLGLPEVE